jgi:hypothetical protein
MDTATLMDECREIDMKIDTDEYLEEFRVNIYLNNLIELSLQLFRH